MRIKRPDAEFFVMDTGNFSENAIDSLCSSQGLFEKKSIVVVDRLLSEKDIKEEILSKIQKMKDTENAFIIFDTIPDKKTTETVKKNSEKVYVFGEDKKPKAKDSRVFDLTNAFVDKNFPKAWVIYQTLIREGSAPEGIHGAFIWQIKDALLAKKTGKWTKYNNRFSEKELDGIFEQLISMYHDIRSHGGELSLQMEKFVLGG